MILGGTQSSDFLRLFFRLLFLFFCLDEQPSIETSRIWSVQPAFLIVLVHPVPDTTNVMLSSRDPEEDEQLPSLQEQEDDDGGSNDRNASMQ